jgi:hypothetical protein
MIMFASPGDEQIFASCGVEMLALQPEFPCKVQKIFCHNFLFPVYPENESKIPGRLNFFY